MTDYLGLLEQCDQLYAGVCFEPEAWSDSALADWMEGIAAGGTIERDVARELRRVLRAAQKLRDFWAAPPANLPPDHGDFRTRVDIAVGLRAWRPVLAIAQHGLAAFPEPELYDEVKERFRVVSGERWMEGVSYDDWLDMPDPSA